MVEVTPAANAHLKSVLEARGLLKHPLRIATVRGPHGCIHGYTLYPDREVTDGDRTIERDGILLVVEEDLVPFLEGARIDWTDNSLTIECPASPPPRHQGGCGGHGAA